MENTIKNPVVLGGHYPLRQGVIVVSYSSGPPPPVLLGEAGLAANVSMRFKLIK